MKQVPVWKTAHVAPVYKKGPKYNPENYRPMMVNKLMFSLWTSPRHSIKSAITITITS
jgi:hypothetical protein